jgi:hypothetical protein
LQFDFDFWHGSSPRRILTTFFTISFGGVFLCVFVIFVCDVSKNYLSGKFEMIAQYATLTTKYHFYFPRAGTFKHFPAHATKDQKVFKKKEKEKIL